MEEHEQPLFKDANGISGDSCWEQRKVERSEIDCQRKINNYLRANYNPVRSRATNRVLDNASRDL